MYSPPECSGSPLCSEDGKVCCLFLRSSRLWISGGRGQGWALCPFCVEGHFLLSMDLQRMLLPASHLAPSSFPGALGGGLWIRAWEGVDVLLVSQLLGSVFSLSLSSLCRVSAHSLLPARWEPSLPFVLPQWR